MASIVERPRQGGSSFQVRWHEHGRQQATTCPTLKAAKRVKAIVEATGTYVDEMGRLDVPTVDEQAAEFLAHGSRGNADTVEGYRRIVERHISPTFGDLAITALTPPMLTTWANQLPGSDKTRANVTAVMSGILKSAVPDWLPSSPWAKVHLRKTDGPKEQHLLTPEDLGLILEEIPERYRPAVATLAGTGIRWGELAGLNVGDADLASDPPVLRVSRAVKHRARQGDTPGVPKTRKSVRRAAVPPQVAQVLAPLTQRPAGEPLFTNSRGNRLRGSTFRGSVWYPALDRAQDRERHDPPLAHRPRIHDLRAFATTWLIEAGVPIDVVADQLGHESVTTTFGIYRRVNPESGRKAAAAMGAVLERVVRPAVEG